MPKPYRQKELWILPNLFHKLCKSNRLGPWFVGKLRWARALFGIALPVVWSLALTMQRLCS